jgi:hypothetical protein
MAPPNLFCTARSGNAFAHLIIAQLRENRLNPQPGSRLLRGKQKLGETSHASEEHRDG